MHILRPYYINERAYPTECLQNKLVAFCYRPPGQKARFIDPSGLLRPHAIGNVFVVAISLIPLRGGMLRLLKCSFTRDSLSVTSRQTRHSCAERVSMSVPFVQMSSACCVIPRNRPSIMCLLPVRSRVSNTWLETICCDLYGSTNGVVAFYLCPKQRHQSCVNSSIGA